MTSAYSSNAGAPLAAPSFHTPEELLVGYANGSLEEAEALLVAVHASLCSLCAAKVSAYERVGGVLLSSQPEEGVSGDLLARTLLKLDTLKPAAPIVPLHDRVLPAPLARLIGPFEGIKWKRALPNVDAFDLPMQLGGVPVRLRRFSPGTGIPRHTHTATEYDLVLTGGVTDNDSGQHMVRGDVSINDERNVHSLTIDEGEECVALSVHNARVKPLGLWARLIYGYTGW